MGGSSKSSSSTVTEQKTTQLSQDGLNTGNVTQAQGDITIQDYFPEDVAQAFGAVLELAGEAMKGAKGVADQALSTVATRVEQQDQPELATLTKFMPVIMLGIVATAAVFIWRRK